MSQTEKIAAASLQKGNVMAKKILLVDDEPNNLFSLEFLMKRAGYEVFTANNGEVALERIALLLPDLVLLDINMPKLNGYQVCERVRATPAWDQIKIILLTAKGRDVEKQRGLAMGANDYITKPFSNQQLIEQIRVILEVD